MMLTVLFLRSPTNLRAYGADDDKAHPTISVLYSVRLTLTNHYWVTSDERRRSISIDEAWLTWESPQIRDPRIALHDVLDQQEKEMIESALAETRGRVSGPDGAAVKLGIPTKTLDSKIKRLGINKFRFKDPRAV